MCLALLAMFFEYLTSYQLSAECTQHFLNDQILFERAAQVLTKYPIQAIAEGLRIAKQKLEIKDLFLQNISD
jgi:hypothetical protein